MEIKMKKNNLIKFLFFIDMIINILILVWAAKNLYLFFGSQKYELMIPLTVFTLIVLMFTLFQLSYFVIVVVMKKERAYNITQIMSFFSVFLEIFFIIVVIIVLLAGIDITEIIG